MEQDTAPASGISLATIAATEAAWAGRRAEGAQVASEVRSPAQRLASATKEIKALIAAFARKVADGLLLQARHRPQ